MLARDRFAVGSCDVVVVLGVGKGRVMLAVAGSSACAFLGALA